MKTNYIDLSMQDDLSIYFQMRKQCKGISWVIAAFQEAYQDYEAGLFTYDGATFVREMDGNYWEVAAFIHDWLNGTGYVGKQPDLYFIKIMMALGYSENIVFERCKWMQWTFLNKIWHQVKGTFIADDLPETLKAASDG
jgi:hypothetical protein